jgi:MSHA biogenesis protein MshO
MLMVTHNSNVGRVSPQGCENLCEATRQFRQGQGEHVGLKPDLQNSKGFTLVEMIIVIVITGIIGGVVAVFIKAPVQGYVDSARRAELTDIADTAVRRMARDVRTAVPNSVRIANCAVPKQCVEFLPTRDGGRYRAELESSGAGDVLNFGAADSSFDIIGTGVTFRTNDVIVVGSTQSDGNLPYNVNSGAVSGVQCAVTGATGSSRTNVTITDLAPGLPNTAALPSQRFDVVDGAQRAVTYACVATGGGACAAPAGGNGTCQLLRYSNYGFNTTQVDPPVGGTSAILADKVSACDITYDVPNQRFGLLAVRLTLTSGGESVTLYNEIHVNNAP